VESVRDGVALRRSWRSHRECVLVTRNHSPLIALRIASERVHARLAAYGFAAPAVTFHLSVWVYAVLTVRGRHLMLSEMTDSLALSLAFRVSTADRLERPCESLDLP
jgi:hypothetical protein